MTQSVASPAASRSACTSLAPEKSIRARIDSSCVYPPPARALFPSSRFMPPLVESTGNSPNTAWLRYSQGSNVIPSAAHMTRHRRHAVLRDTAATRRSETRNRAGSRIACVFVRVASPRSAPHIAAAARDTDRIQSSQVRRRRNVKKVSVLGIATYAMLFG